MIITAKESEHMAVNLDSYAEFDKHRDDPVFMEYLLKNHSDIIDQKEGVDKILYSMEIARLLARVAVHERCLADYEKRSRDEDKYQNYHKTALYIARKGIDIGVNMAYDAHDDGKDSPDIAYNHYMGWIYVQYSMMLLETHRYFAAMSAITYAENFLIHDWYNLVTKANVNEIRKELKKIPQFEKISFNLSANQLMETLQKDIELVFSELLEAINEKKLRILYKVYKEVPNRYRDLYARLIMEYLADYLEKNKEGCLKKFAEVGATLNKEYPTIPEKILDLPDLSIKDAEHKETIEEKEYVLWVISGGLALSYLDFYPDLNKRCEYETDDLIFDFQTQELNIVMEDIMETFAHCRYQVYSATHYPSTEADIAYCISPKAKRIFNQELLLDVFPRLYSILDKVSHIVIKSFEIELTKKEGSYYSPAPSYNLLVKELRNHYGGNPYLLTLCEIFDEINPYFVNKMQRNNPVYSMLPNLNLRVV